jgi:hypothetical protein
MSIHNFDYELVVKTNILKILIKYYMKYLHLYIFRKIWSTQDI